MRFSRIKFRCIYSECVAAVFGIDELNNMAHLRSTFIDKCRVAHEIRSNQFEHELESTLQNPCTSLSRVPEPECSRDDG